MGDFQCDHHKIISRIDIFMGRRYLFEVHGNVTMNLVTCLLGFVRPHDFDMGNVN